MAVDLALLVMTPSLQRGHLIELMRGYTDSGFFDIDDPERRARQDALIDEARRAFTDMEVFADGPLKGKAIRSVSTRFQTLGLAHRFMAFEPVAQNALDAVSHDVLDLHGTVFVVTENTVEIFADAFRAIDCDPEPVIEFLRAHIGLVAAFVGE